MRLTILRSKSLVITRAPREPAHRAREGMTSATTTRWMAVSAQALSFGVCGPNAP
jgi:hypothetical protein